MEKISTIEVPYGKGNGNAYFKRAQKQGVAEP